jgi:3',5'-nucleoside bisphosphate phosphatase
MPAGQPFTSLCQQMARPASAGRVDLHIHTTASDGTYTPAEVVDLACRSGLSALAVTDHDILDAIGPARTAAAGRLEVIAGVEISAEFRGKELHLLGYFFDPDDAALNKALADSRRQRSERFQEMVERLRHQGVPLEDEAWPSTRGTIALGRRHLAEMLVKAGRAGNVRQAFFRYLGDHGRVAVPKRNMPVAEAISLIRAAGGVASWAHPSSDCTKTSLQELRDLGMQAVETDFPSCRPGRRHELRALAGRLNLAITGGSDCHGPGLPRRAIGACGLNAKELEVLRAQADRAVGVT